MTLYRYLALLAALFFFLKVVSACRPEPSRRKRSLSDD